MRMCQVSLTCTASVHFQLTSLKFTAFKTATKLCTLSILAKNTWSSCEALDADILFASHVTHATQGSAMCTWRVYIYKAVSKWMFVCNMPCVHTHTHIHIILLMRSPAIVVYARTTMKLTSNSSMAQLIHNVDKATKYTRYINGLIMCCVVLMLLCMHDELCQSLVLLSGMGLSNFTLLPLLSTTMGFSL